MSDLTQRRQDVPKPTRRIPKRPSRFKSTRKRIKSCGFCIKKTVCCLPCVRIPMWICGPCCFWCYDATKDGYHGTVYVCDMAGRAPIFLLILTIVSAIGLQIVEGILGFPLRDRP